MQANNPARKAVKVSY